MDGSTDIKPSLQSSDETEEQNQKALSNGEDKAKDVENKMEKNDDGIASDTPVAKNDVNGKIEQTTGNPDDIIVNQKETGEVLLNQDKKPDEIVSNEPDIKPEKSFENESEQVDESHCPASPTELLTPALEEHEVVGVVVTREPLVHEDICTVVNNQPILEFAEEHDEESSQNKDVNKEREEINEEGPDTYLIQQEAEKQVMHELINETVVLEKERNSIQVELDSANERNKELHSRIDELVEEKNKHLSRIAELEKELKQAQMGDGEQRRLLEETQQKVADLEAQLKRLASDDEGKSQRLTKAEKEVLELTEKCKKLEQDCNDSENNQQSKTCVVM